MSGATKSGIAVVTAMLSVVLAAWPQSPKPRVNDGAVVQDFENRVNQYLQQRQEKAGRQSGPTTSAAKLKNTQEGIRARIQAQRANAKQGDIFTPEIAAYLHRQIASAFSGERGARVAASLQHAEPQHQVKLTVNQPYPDGIPLQSMPPTLLLKLPQLPKELQYRIVGRDLVLLDTEPNLVVDILPDAIPAK